MRSRPNAAHDHHIKDGILNTRTSQEHKPSEGEGRPPRPPAALSLGGGGWWRMHGAEPIDRACCQLFEGTWKAAWPTPQQAARHPGWPPLARLVAVVGGARRRGSSLACRLSMALGGDWGGGGTGDG